MASFTAQDWKSTMSGWSTTEGFSKQPSQSVIQNTVRLVKASVTQYEEYEETRRNVAQIIPNLQRFGLYHSRTALTDSSYDYIVHLLLLSNESIDINAEFLFQKLANADLFINLAIISVEENKSEKIRQELYRFWVDIYIAHSIQKATKGIYNRIQEHSLEPSPIEEVIMLLKLTVARGSFATFFTKKKSPSKPYRRPRSHYPGVSRPRQNKPGRSAKDCVDM